MRISTVSKEDVIQWINNLHKEADDLYLENHKLREEINHLKFISKNEKIKELKDTINTLTEENRNLREQIFYGFTKEDYKKAGDWYVKHKTGELPQKGDHRLEWIVYPSELGPIKIVRCSCGKELELTKAYEFG